MPSPFEFPTDNPELFTARPPSVFPRAPALVVDEPTPASVDEPKAELICEPVAVQESAPDEEPEIEIVDSFDDAEFVEQEPETQTADPIALYLSELTAAAFTAGATNEAVSALAAVLGFERFDASLTSEATMQRLHEVGLVAKVNGVYARSEAVVAVAQAWSAALRGKDPDFTACGTKMFDEFSAEVVSKLANAPQRLEMVRRDLRSRGIAAFGLVAA